MRRSPLTWTRASPALFFWMGRMMWAVAVHSSREDGDYPSVADIFWAKIWWVQVASFGVSWVAWHLGDQLIIYCCPWRYDPRFCAAVLFSTSSSSYFWGHPWSLSLRVAVHIPWSLIISSVRTHLARSRTRREVALPLELDESAILENTLQVIYLRFSKLL